MHHLFNTRNKNVQNNLIYKFQHFLFEMNEMNNVPTDQMLQSHAHICEENVASRDSLAESIGGEEGGLKYSSSLEGVCFFFVEKALF